MTTTYTSATLFSGGGGADIGALMAGFTPVCANEYDPAIAAVYAQNLGDHVRVGDILLENPRDWPDTDHLHASPPCPNFSAAKANAAETPHDIALSTKVAEFIAVKKPRWFTLENVPAYRKSASFAIICKALGENGYVYDAPVLNSADFLVPQTRKRLFLRATRDGLLRPLPEPTRWVGWLEAIADILDTLPESEFAEWQLKRMGEAMKKMQRMTDDVFIGGANKSESFLQFAVENRPTIPGIRNSDEPMSTVPADLPTLSAGKAFIANTNASERGDVLREEAEPAYTVTGAGSGGRSRAFIVDGSGIEGERMTVREHDSPSNTVTAHYSKHPSRAWLSQGRVVKMTPRALARFQSFPDWYILPEKTALACRIIGNAVPPLMAAAVLRSLRE